MAKKNFLEQKYCEINQLKNLLQTYPKEYCETIIKVMEKVFDETGSLWEKYNVVEGNINVIRRTTMPSMMGKSAGSYLMLKKYAEEGSF